MKKIIALFLALVMALSLVACGGTDKPDTTPSTEPSVESTPAASDSVGASFTVVVTDLDGSERKDSLADAGRENKDSRRTVAYLIRLTYLHRDLLEMVDNGTIGFKVGVAMSYLTPATQELLLTEILSLGIKVHGSQIDRLRDMETTGVITADSMREVFKQPSKPKPLPPSAMPSPPSLRQNFTPQKPSAPLSRSTAATS